MRIPYFRLTVLLAALSLGCAAHAQTRSPGWEFRADVIYQNSKGLEADGGSRATLHSDWGGSLGIGFRFNSKFETHFMLDWQSNGYDAHIIRGDANGSANISGTLDLITPRAMGVYNFMDGPITPYVSAAVGWTFIDTNIPNGAPQTGCWWDPWWGYICNTYQSTRSNNGIEYDMGAGVRWDISHTFGLRLGYEKHWVGIGGGVGTPNLDQFRLGLQVMY